MLNTTLSINPIYKNDSTIWNTIPKNQAKEGLTLRLKLDHFLTLYKHIHLLDL